MSSLKCMCNRWITEYSTNSDMHNTAKKISDFLLTCTKQLQSMEN
jgi:hypothetical protein